MIKEKLDLRGKTALVTGGSQGIGRAIALGLAEFGANVVINYFGDREEAEKTVGEIKDQGVEGYVIEEDISTMETPDRLVTFTKNMGLEVDILVLNASVQFRRRWNDIDIKEFDLQLNTNFRASLLMIRKFYPDMKKRKWGRILCIGSVQLRKPHPEMLVYSSTKAAQMNMVKVLAPLLAPDGITINNLSPGVIETKRNEKVLKDSEYRSKVVSGIPMGFIGLIEDISALASVLCTEGSRYITGQDIYVDGGMGL